MSTAPSASGALRRRTALAVAVTSLAVVAAALPSPGPVGIGDRLFPTLGNPGYDVRAYDIALHYSGDNTVPLHARTVLRARVTSRVLDRFHLDFTGGKVSSVRVNGRPAQHRTAGEDLVVTPASPVFRGMPLRVVIRHTSPTDDAERGGWVRTGDGLAMANQADAAHRVFPCNDHPSDKAAFTFRITAPRKLTVVAGGRRIGKEREGAETTWTYQMGHPMATELAQVSIGTSAVPHRRGPHGLPLRDVVPAKRRAALEPWLARTPEQIAWMERAVGRFPFGTYGVLAADATTGFELETQTLSLFESGLFTAKKYPKWYVESVMVHELAHQWFGDSVSPHRWTDLWLNEGHATWYEWRYGAKQGGTSVEKRARNAYANSDDWRRQYGPPAALRPAEPGSKISIFRPIVYDGSAVFLYALRQKIGSALFGRLERAWVRTHRDGTASTSDFMRLAGQVSGQDLTAFLTAWLYGKKTPPMPGHPQWKARKSG